jgi:hypothetical protein
MVIEAGEQARVTEVTVTVVAVTVTVTEALVLPPVPVQVRVNVAGPVAVGFSVAVPLSDSVSDQLPDAAAEVAFVQAYVRVVELPSEMLGGFALSAAVGLSGGGGGEILPPPHPVMVKAITPRQTSPDAMDKTFAARVLLRMVVLLSMHSLLNLS